MDSRTRNAKGKFQAKYSHNPDAFKETTDESAYWIGFLMADGCISEAKGSQTRVRLVLKKEDIDHLQKFKEFVKSDKPIYEYDHNKSVEFSLNSSKMVKDLIHWGVTPRKSLTAKAHPDLEMNPHFWRGIIDGDGCIHTNKKGYKALILIGSEFICKQFIEWASTVHTTKASVRATKGSAFQVTVPAQYYLEELYGNSPHYYLKRKKEVAIGLDS